MGSDTDWNRIAVRRLILNAEDTLAVLDDAMKHSDPAELARAIRNGRRAYKELVNRRKNHLLTPLSGAALEKLLDKITAKLVSSGKNCSTASGGPDWQSLRV